jgi:hypothetical protein
LGNGASLGMTTSLNRSPRDHGTESICHFIRKNSG